MLQEFLHMEGHLIDSDILRRAFARIVEEGGAFEVAEFRVGRTNEEPSFVRLAVQAPDPATLDRILGELSYLGADSEVVDARFAPAERDGILPDEFYASTNMETYVRVDGAWRAVPEQRMDCAVILRDGVPHCVKARAVRAGEPVLVRGRGIRVRPIERARRYTAFGFMSNETTAEANKSVAIEGVVQAVREARNSGERIVVVAGPAVVHSGGREPLARLVSAGWVDVLLSGNAFAVHDLEAALLGTSLGVCQLSGRATEGGNRNHLFAINAVNRAGGVRAAVESGLVRDGVLYEAVRRGIPIVLAGSVRDDGPLADVITDAREAQDAYAEALSGAGVCLLLATALHAIAVGNLLPAKVRTVCVDMTESVPLKLANRGSGQAMGLVTDVGFFLERLDARLGRPAP